MYYLYYLRGQVSCVVALLTEFGAQVGAKKGSFMRTRIRASNQDGIISQNRMNKMIYHRQTQTARDKVSAADIYGCTHAMAGHGVTRISGEKSKTLVPATAG